LPERLILGDPDADFESHLRSIGLGGDPERFSPQVLDAYRTQAADPGAVRNACEDYRAGATIDRVHDEADRGRVIDCPVLVLWGERGGLATLFGDVLAIWGRWAADVRGRAIDASHFLAEDRPQEVADEFAEFFAPTDRR
jgi:haloacetate dehalogenase